ncbi:MAG: CoA transferase, partial [Desulfocapsaceae bacterium]|nr:CoA transferase [Desulfocapsaceae bacterium]
KLCTLLAMDEYVDRQYDEDCRLEIIARLRDCFSRKTRDEWNGILAGRDVCYSEVKDYHEVLDSRLFRERGLVVDRREDNGSVVSELGIAVKLSETPGSLRTSASDFGADTEAVLKELGYSLEQIEAFAAGAVI